MQSTCGWLRLGTVVLAAGSALMSGCATSEQVQAVATQDFGPVPPAAVWQPAVAEWFTRALKDPDSAQYRMGCPQRGYVKNAVLSGRPGIEFVGYIARIEVNGKNSFGGYSGYAPYLALIARGGEVVDVYSMGGLSGGHPRVTVLDANPCETPVRVTLPKP